MAYIGKSPSVGIRDRYYFTADSGDTTVSGLANDGRTLTFTDGKYVDVKLNGITLVAGTDYITAVSNTISSLAPLAQNDVVEVVVYDVFSIADVVSASRGGAFQSRVTFENGITLTDSGGIIGDIKPSADSAYDIGDSALAFKDAYFSGTVNALRYTGDGSLLTGTGGGYFKGENGISGNASTGLGDIFRVHENALDTAVTIDSDTNAVASGPLTLNATLTINGTVTIV